MIKNRELPAGTRLVATYKKQAYVCTVEEGEDGKKAYVLEGGRRYTSPSAAASAIMGGIAANGWRWWSVEGSEPASASAPVEAAKAAKRDKAPAKKKGTKTGGGTKKTGRRRNGNHPLLHPTASQEGVAEGRVAWFCDACADVFTMPAGVEPRQCPAGHRADAPEFEGDAPHVEDTEPQFDPEAEMEPVA